MGNKKKQLDEVDSLRVKVKELESSNRMLRKRLKRLEIFADQADSQEEVKEELQDLKDEKPQEDNTNKCPNCGSDLSTIRTAGRRFERCSRQANCYRTKAVLE